LHKVEVSFFDHENEVPNFNKKYPIVYDDHIEKNLIDYDFVIKKQNMKQNTYTKNDYNILNKWVTDDKHPSIKYFVADIRSKIFTSYSLHIYLLHTYSLHIYSLHIHFIYIHFKGIPYILELNVRTAFQIHYHSM